MDVPFLDRVHDTPGAIVAMAHRGGLADGERAGLENSIATFQHCVTLGYDYIETDVHASRDGVLFAMHDASLDRTTDRRGEVAKLDAAEVEQARVGGEYTVPRLETLLEEFPDCCFNVDLKSPGAVAPLAGLIAKTNAQDRIMVGSFSASSLNRFRRLSAGRVATSASPPEVAAFVLAPGRVAQRLTRNRVAALQIPVRFRGVPVLTAGALRHAHRVGVAVHAWTINDTSLMNSLLDMGVDGMISDQTVALKAVLVQRGIWRGTP